MRRVLVIAPTAPEHARYRQRAVRHAIDAGEAPISPWVEGDDMAVVNHSVTVAWLGAADVVALYVDTGISSDMAVMSSLARGAGVPVELRTTQPDVWAHAIRNAMRADRAAEQLEKSIL